MSTYKSYIITTGSLLSLAMLSGLVLLSNHVSADNDSIVDEINITVPVSCSLNGTGMNSHNATINNGQYDSAIGETTIKAMCNDSNGFAIYAIGYTDDIDGKNVLTSSALGSTHDILTGTATSGNTSNWAMKLTAVASPTPTYPIIIAGSTDDTDKEQGDPDYTVFQQVPDDYTKVAYRKSSTDTGTSAEGSSMKTTYQAYISPTQPAGTYTGQVKYTMVHPYSAAAPEKSAVSIDTATTLQDAAICADNLTIGQAYTLVDSRDNEQYKVAKLADGNCWILDNLRLDPTSSTIRANLSSSNTNASDAAIANYLYGGSTTEGWSNVAVYNEPYYFHSFTEPMVNNEYKNEIVTSFGDSSGKTGIYYNYCAATVGTICYDENYQGRGVATYDICPAHWHLPTNNQYSALVAEYTSEGSLQQAMGASLTGSYYYSNLDGFNRHSNLNEWGYYWGSEMMGDAAWALPVDDGYEDWQLRHDRDGGDTIRCVLDS